MREEFKQVHTEEFPPNDTPAYTSNLLWQEWDESGLSTEPDGECSYPPGHDTWQDSQDPWPDPSTWRTWPTQQTNEDAWETSQNAWPPWPTPPK